MSFFGFTSLHGTELTTQWWMRTHLKKDQDPYVAPSLLPLTVYALCISKIEILTPWRPLLSADPGILAKSPSQWRLLYKILHSTPQMNLLNDIRQTHFVKLCPKEEFNTDSRIPVFHFLERRS
jgi:hypothetical protein